MSHRVVRMRSVCAGVAVLAAVLGAGCASSPPYAERTIVGVDRAIYQQPQSHPAVGVVHTAQVGDSMVSTTKELVMPRLNVKTALRVTAPYKQTQKMAFDIEVGEKELIGRDPSGGSFYASSTGVPNLYEGKSGFELDSNVKGGVYVDVSGIPHVYWLWEGYQRAYVLPAPQLQYERIHRATGDVRSTSLRRELVYSGVSQSTVSLLYREFVDDMARPAFSQELRYDLSQGNVIGYQGARFEVLRAENTGITYRVLAHMPLPTR